MTPIRMTLKLTLNARFNLVPFSGGRPTHDVRMLRLSDLAMRYWMNIDLNYQQQKYGQILQGSVVTQTTLDDLTVYRQDANFIQCICAKNYENWLAVNKVIAKIIKNHGVFGDERSMQTRSAFRNHSGTRSAPARFVRRVFQNGSGMHYAFAYFSHLQIPPSPQRGEGNFNCSLLRKGPRR